MASWPKGNEAIAHGALLVYAFLVSTSFTVGAAITHDLDPLVLTFLRFLVAAAVFGIGLALSGRWQWPGLGGLLRYAAIALTMVLFFVLMFEALRWTDTLSTGAIFTLVPLMAAGIAFLLVGQRCPSGQLGCLLLGGLGAVWVLFEGSLDRLLALDLGYGDILFFFSAVSFSAYAPAIKRLHRGEPVVVMTFWVLAAGAGLLAIYAGPQILATDWTGIPAKALGGVFYLAICNTAFTFYLAKFASLHLPPHRVMAYTYLTPAFVVLIEAGFGAPWPTLPVFLGIAVTAIAMLLLLRSPATP